MTNDYCSYELSKQLKACGFAEKCHRVYMRDRQSDTWELTDWMVEEKDYNKRTRPIYAISAPTLWQAQKWLREKKGIIVIAEPDYDSEDYCLSDYLTGAWYFTVWKDINRVHCNFDPDAEEERLWMFEKYEQALSAGIAAALELIKKGE